MTVKPNECLGKATKGMHCNPPTCWKGSIPSHTRLSLPPLQRHAGQRPRPPTPSGVSSVVPASHYYAVALQTQSLTLSLNITNPISDPNPNVSNPICGCIKTWKSLTQGWATLMMERTTIFSHSLQRATICLYSQRLQNINKYIFKYFFIGILKSKSLISNASIYGMLC